MIVIPDVHGRTFWRQAVNEYLGKEHILFLGDYLDPYTYEGITPTDAYKVFHEIIELKSKLAELESENQKLREDKISNEKEIIKLETELDERAKKNNNNGNRK
jgi:hypothetical protein